MQKYADLVLNIELEKCCKMHGHLQLLVSMQPKTSPPKIAKIKSLNDPRAVKFENYLAKMMLDLAYLVIQDGEGITKFIEIIERRQGLKIACIEEIAFQQGYISKQQLVELAQPLIKNKYGQYLLKCAEEDF